MMSTEKQKNWKPSRTPARLLLWEDVVDAIIPDTDAIEVPGLLPTDFFPDPDDVDPDKEEVK
jgi:hypothetical protein